MSGKRGALYLPDRISARRLCEMLDTCDVVAMDKAGIKFWDFEYREWLSPLEKPELFGAPPSTKPLPTPQPRLRQPSLF